MRMDIVKAVIDGVQARFNKGTTILDAAKKMGVSIPTLCHHENLTPFGGCRICVVEVEGRDKLVGSCHTPIEEGMVILTRSHKVTEARKATIELLFAGHTGPCVTDGRIEECELHNIASDAQAGPPRFSVRKPRFYPMEDISPYIRRDLSKCILCRRCIRACRELAGQSVYSTAYRGFKSKVIVDFDVPLNKEVCKDCGICIDHCPTSALGWPIGVLGIAKEAKRKTVEEKPTRDQVFQRLKEEQRKSGFISKQALTEIAECEGVTLSDAYGVATFYAFLSVEPLGRHVIRMCRSLCCDLKDGKMILECLNKELGIRPGETTQDNRFSLTLTNCIGACDQAPAILIDQDLHGNLTQKKMVEILRSYN
jgi:NADH:ubiquinone oxidoreductase subunit E/Pyruvate/2-oxoacid:ferredoxin oxidoreductase delta subunit/ferredoxin